MTASQVKDSLLVPSEQTGAAGNNAQIVGPYCTHCRVNSNNKQIKYVIKTVVKTGRVSKINNPK
jgi:hypothetical protein